MKQLLSFLGEYAAFLEQTAVQEQEKHAALVSYDHKRTDKAIATQQATQMQLEQFELRRARLQQEAGLAGLEFREILARTEGDTREQLEGLFRRIELAIWEIKYLNRKSLAFARAGVKTLGDLERVMQGPSYTGGGKKAAEGNIPLFEAKI